jgi:glycosyltransferase involved in cell wall biosynthesis
MGNERRTSRRQLSLVMPAYNEEAGIQVAVAEAHEALAGLDAEYEILVVDDGSADRTAELVNELASMWPDVRLIRHERNRGYGAALRTGFESARFPLVAFTDADGQFFLEDLECLLQLTDRYAIVAGRRLDRQDPWRRRFFSWGYNKLVRFLLGTGVHDCDCALKVFHRDVLLYLLPEADGFFVNAEMLCRARRLGVEVAEVGVRHRPRRHGASKISLLDIPRTLAKLLPFWWSGRVASGGWRVASGPLPIASFQPFVSSRSFVEPVQTSSEALPQTDES